MGRISKADRFMIMGLWKEKKWGAKRLITKFSGKRWPKTSITCLLQKNRQLQDNRKEVGQAQ